MISDDLIIYCGHEDLAAAAPLIGAKGLNLLRLQAMGRPVPPWYSVTVRAFRTAMRKSGIDRRIGVALDMVEGGEGTGAALSEIRDEIARVPLPEKLRSLILEAYRRSMGEDAYVAVRSSASDEDNPGQSFAGLHDSFLYVKGGEEVLFAVRRVWASAYNERAIAYRLENGLSCRSIGVAVIIQEMIEASVSGVMFTVNPVSGDLHEIVISSVYGAGEGLVSGGLDADTFTVRKEDLFITPQIADKREQVVPDGDSGRGVKTVPVPEDRRRAASLTDEQVRQLARAGLAIERAYGRPQDIEFSLDRDDVLYLLQSRPVTTVEEFGPAAGNRLVWDNSNIIESYCGVTTPMTFSFIRHAYTIVYHCFAEVMGVSPKIVRANKVMFENMLGLFRGRVYYNLLNWYRLVRLFPGFNYNRQFMESMMGVKEPVKFEEEYLHHGFLRKYFMELPKLARLLARSIANFARINSLTSRFEDHFRKHYSRWVEMDFRQKRPHELIAIYRDMDRTLLWNWRAPIINDFFVMFFYGVLKKLCVKWCGDQRGSLQNDLLCGEGGIESTEPTRMLLHLAGLAQGNDDLRTLILGEPAGKLVGLIAGDSRFGEFSEELERYLALYGFRCMNELKLEEYSLHDRPEFIYTIIRNYLSLDNARALDIEVIAQRERRIRRDAEERAFSAVGKLPFGFFRKIVFRRVLRNARVGVKNRENMRFARTRIYGLLRELIRALGGCLAREGILKDPEDVFYLTLDECADYIQGTAVTTNLSALAELRRIEFDAYRAEEEKAPDDRFETYGMAYNRNLFKGAVDDLQPSRDGVLRGTGCCPGEVTGPVKVLRTPRDDMRLSGEILVAERTDPGWVPLYPSVSGLLIERGSILSHSAIVAREMGIPTIVGIPGLMAAVTTGQTVRMNGAAGTVEVVRG
ncbi:MAG: phosphoenolpyruvate synthase [Candidatus Tritonobacter lacicola]|nr:phosphoenolpyruvate synthase [Candidatus Tritonobacter lacicola]